MKRFRLTDTSNYTDSQYQDYILQGVSRTFALTIPQLSKELVQVVGNAYLWCRMADTIEDDPQLALALKGHFSDQLSSLLSSQESTDAWVTELQPHLHCDTAPAELDLIANSQRILRLFRAFSPAQQSIIQQCVATMVQGMMHYQAHQPHSGLPNMPAFNDYCYHVAGIVGEMLTLLYCDYSKGFKDNKAQLMPLSVSFGQGLQMTNILKDIWQDQGREICWLPQDVFSKYNIQLQDLSKQRTNPDFHQGVRELVAIAHGHLQDALRYTLLIPKAEQGYRNFCLWAIGMALLTLKNIYKQPDFQQSSQIKISRNKVKTIFVVTRFIGRSNSLVKLFFKRIARDLP
ncbi:phytoene/squalene synthase family protein [Oceanospirillaceae bacterium]|jgi:farnesyl-diphosphate farnesyltransferase|nr:phytoene/squalene synthase family protein [Oceanospirillaceae bacterium]|tara:strand:+ start:563 stop:1597 length:1035 start_codon:yes stop_codon:yes gene_type:complete